MENLQAKRLHRGAITVAHVVELFLSSLVRVRLLRNPVIRSVFFRQLYFTAVEPLAVVCLVGAAVGFLFIVQITALLKGNVAAAAPVVDKLVMGELSNLLCIVLVLVRSGPAIGSELAGMSQRGEVRALYIMGIDATDYLVVPRILGVGTAMIVLGVFFRTVSLFVGLSVASLVEDVNFAAFAHAVAAEVTPFSALTRAAKGFAVGGAAAALLCHYGLRVSHNPSDLPRATRAAVVHGLMLVMGINAIFWVL